MFPPRERVVRIIIEATKTCNSYRASVTDCRQAICHLNRTTGTFFKVLILLSFYGRKQHLAAPTVATALHLRAYEWNDLFDDGEVLRGRFAVTAGCEFVLDLLAFVEIG